MYKIFYGPLNVDYMNTSDAWAFFRPDTIFEILNEKKEKGNFLLYSLRRYIFQDIEMK